MIFIFKINTNTVVWMMCILQIIIELVRLFVWRLMIDWLPFITLCNIASDKWKNIIDFLQIMVNCGRLTMMIMLLPCSCINSYIFLLDNSTNSDRFTPRPLSLSYLLILIWYLWFCMTKIGVWTSYSNGKCKLTDIYYIIFTTFIKQIKIELMCIINTLWQNTKQIYYCKYELINE